MESQDKINSRKANKKSEVFSIRPKKTKKSDNITSPGEMGTLESKRSIEENLKKVSLPQIDLVLGKKQN